MIALRESAKPTLLLIVFTAVGAAQPSLAQDRIARIHERYVFADMHAHPSRFHRANVPRVAAEEIARYRRGTMDIVVSTISTDAIYSGNGWISRNRGGRRTDRRGARRRGAQP